MGRPGLLFGVQSPSVAPSDLLEHIEHFLSDLPGMIDGIDEATFIAQRQALADQFDSAALPMPRPPNCSGRANWPATRRII